MAKTSYFSADILARAGLLLVFAALALLQGAIFGDASSMYFWMALIILLFETIKLPLISNVNAAAAEAILALTMVIGGIRGLIMSFGKSFNATHIYLSIFILGGAVLCFAVYKRLNPSGSRR